MCPIHLRLTVSLLALISFARATASDVTTVDATTLRGKVMVGYHGWYNAEGDGGNRGWIHWTKDKTKPINPDNVGVELFPDLSEFSEQERYSTTLVKPDGKPVEIYSSLNQATVRRHFKWMHDYHIDGAFLKRFALDLQHPHSTRHTNAVLANARKAAPESGRAYAIMYVLNGLSADKIDMVIEDWGRLGQIEQITDDPSYLKHEGKPVVAIKGVGIEGQKYSIAECQKLVSFLKEQGCTVMIGTASDWLEGRDDDDAGDAARLALLEKVDIISPDTIGKYNHPRQVRREGQSVWAAEKAWCDDRGIDYLPVIYPGYSRSSLNAEKQNLVPRRHGKFLWAQFQSARNAGCEMAYIATFDGMHNGTAIFKFDQTALQIEDINGIGFEDIPSDYYLKLTGEGGMLLKNAQDGIPAKAPRSVQYSSLP